jgi:hypothetical protein
MANQSKEMEYYMLEVDQSNCQCDNYLEEKKREFRFITGIEGTQCPCCPPGVLVMHGNLGILIAPTALELYLASLAAEEAGFFPAASPP